jgi:hypothetical protein
MAEDPSTGRIVVFGGVDEQLKHPDLATWVLDPATRAWTRVATGTVPEPKALMGMAWLGSVGAVVAATGDPNEQDNGYSNSVWAFDADTGDWRQLAATGGPPTPRMCVTLTANPDDGSAILIGGAGDDKLPPTVAGRSGTCGRGGLRHRPLFPAAIAQKGIGSSQTTHRQPRYWVQSRSGSQTTSSP